MSTTFDKITQSSRYRSAKKELLNVLKEELSAINSIKPSAAEAKAEYLKLVTEVGNNRGRELYYPWVGSGAGNGPFIELADGAVKYDLITGIGVNFFGHGNLDLFEAQVDSLWCDVMQGNLGPGPEYGALQRALLSCLGPKSKLKHVWLTTCGAIANETALKIIRQKKAPATKVFAFEHCFAGRTTALQEITDNPKYREGQPVYGEVTYLPFFDEKSGKPAAEQAAKAIEKMNDEMARAPGKYACLEFELVQGEGGFNSATREFWVPILEAAKKAGLYVWVDEIQTFGRTGEVFCFQRFGLEEYVDVVSVAKLLQNGALLFSGDLNPKAGLVSGTFAGASSGLRAGVKAVELLRTKLCGEKGRIRELERMTEAAFAQMKAGPAGQYIQDYTIVGGMQAITLFDGSMEKTKKFLLKLWDMGAAAFFCGHGPYRVRMLPPWGNITDTQWTEVLGLIEKAILETGKELS